MRSVKKIHKATFSPIADLKTHSPLPSPQLKQIDPFIFLNHHGPQDYKPNNNGLPFGPHPHRGMETVTFIIDGQILHKDSGGYESVIGPGGVQWMTAGKGLIHAEVSPEEFKKKGGKLEILQLWVNLPAKFKMTNPLYVGKQKDEIPSFLLDNGKVSLQLISGDWEEHKGAFNSLTEIMLSTIYFKKGGRFIAKVPVEKNIFLYIIRGILQVNSEKTEGFQLIEFEKDGDVFEIIAEEDSTIIFGHAKPLNEPMVAQGPFVMNSLEEIHQAYEDYRNGKFGTWGY